MTDPNKEQLDRIERKLDELLLLSRWPIQTAPPLPERQTSPNPNYEKAPWWMNPDIPPPTLTCTNGGTPND